MARMVSEPGGPAQSGGDVRRAVDDERAARQRAEAALRLSEERYQVLTDELQVGVIIQGPRAEILLSNRRALELLGLTEAQLLGTTSFDPTWNVIHEDGAPFPGPTHPVPTAIATGQAVRNVVMGVYRPTSGDRAWLIVNAFPKVGPDGQVRQVVCTFADITARKHAEEDYQTLFRAMRDGFALHELIYDDHGRPVDYRFLAVNPAFERMTGLGADRVVGQTVTAVLPGIEPAWIEIYGEVVRTGEPASFERFSADLTKHFHVTAFRSKADQFACIVRDVSDRMRAERERATLEAELHQAQKMESVGRLAGGVAHDFNNMLGVILGHLELALEEVEPGQQLAADLHEIRKAAEHSAELTRQLLAFARKQIVAPTVLDLGQAVGGMVKMLQRLIGENIVLEQRRATDLWKVKVDPSQIDQLLANLCVNARDAIAGAGKVVIELSNRTVAAGRAVDGAEIEPGAYVRLTVTDDGCGMDPETLTHIFEPFFTTKALGKGTGLGLATAYGIVKQNRGFIEVASEVGGGTSFAVHLPRHVGTAAEVGGAVAAAARGHETILVVEDEPAILRVTTRILAKLGYVVLPARTPGEALRLAEEHRGHIDLLLSDVMMPEMNGRELVVRLLADQPRLRHLFMSGYTADVIAQQGVLDGAADILRKPFARAALAAGVRKALDRDPPP